VPIEWYRLHRKQRRPVLLARGLTDRSNAHQRVRLLIAPLEGDVAEEAAVQVVLGAFPKIGEVEQD
jgi:hypothetical protein